jgi:anti-sigma factor RsiW
MTRALTCEETQHHLPAYRDGELDLDAQIAVRAHIATCPKCATEAETLQQLGAVLRGASTRRVEVMGDTIGSLHARVVARVQAEQPHRSRTRRLRDLDDLHLLWAAGGATLATLVCMLALLGVVRMSLREVPQSMASILEAMADPGSDRNPLVPNARMLLPRADPAAMMLSPLPSPMELELVFSAVVTREGRVRDVAWVPTSALSARGRRDILDLLDAASQTRFEPARSGGAPVAVNVVWLLSHTTVVGKFHERDLIPSVAPTWRRLREGSSATRPGTPISETRPTTESTAV